MKNPANRPAPSHRIGRNLPSILLVVAILVMGVTLPLLYRLCRSSTNIGSLSATPSSDSSTLPSYWSDSDASTFSGPGADGPIYPYSIIPGGVADAKKLQTALQQDPVAAAHYRGFRGESAHVIRLVSDRQVYVSYRIADRIYWSRKKVSLRAGETLLTDGTNLARTRCGNRISELPAEPTAPVEPPAAVLNALVLPALPFMSPETVPAPLWAENPTPFLLALSNGAQGPGPEGPFLPLLPLFPCCGGSLGPTPNHPSPPPPGPLPQPYPPPPLPPVLTSEPRSLALFLTGFAGVLLLWKLRRS
jgi:hypothetical protein